MVNYGIETLARRFELRPRPGPCDSKIVAELWLKLIEETGRISLPVISQINKLIADTGHPLCEVFQEAEKRILKTAFAAGGTTLRVDWDDQTVHVVVAELPLTAGQAD